jgi:hypothetical protein
MAQVLLASSTVGSGGTASITLGSGGTIPQTYTDLLVRISGRSTSANGGYQVALYVKPNNATSTYASRWMQAEGTATVNSSSSAYFNNTGVANAGNIVPSDWTGSYFSVNELYIPNYRGSQNKTMMVASYAGNNATTASTFFGGNIWASTAAITSLVFVPSHGSIAEFSTIYLYGIS